MEDKELKTRRKKKDGESKRKYLDSKRKDTKINMPGR